MKAEDGKDYCEPEIMDSEDPCLSLIQAEAQENERVSCIPLRGYLYLQRLPLNGYLTIMKEDIYTLHSGHRMGYGAQLHSLQAIMCWCNEPDV